MRTPPDGLAGRTEPASLRDTAPSLGCGDLRPSSSTSPKTGTQPMKSRKLSRGPAVTGQCLCGAVQFEMEYPAFWAWHDHSRASRLAHGAVYATYVGTWRKRFRITAGEREINRFEEKETGAVRSFCRRCGTPLI